MRIPYEIFLGIQVVNINWGTFGARNEYVCAVRGRGNRNFGRAAITTALDGAVTNPHAGYPHVYHVQPQEGHCAGLTLYGYPAFTAGGFGNNADLYRAIYANDPNGGVRFCGMVFHPAANDNRLNYCTRR
ncbi:hypothetical protein ETB97_011583 [Aspergillus alliaceus]|uniref:Uncharacterized protein n=1 Tax=Petromyces alliaceus TaxID=209559 RepID=A0A5N7BXI8_PETAA|nr:hypothetical protein BDV23DRAFT_187383 [Aspergillus alliaceus]KAF5862487.1 hypothetical protein ETB97_011583 [Aspergillus burnettii]